ncbi:hypothetical protein FGO68_gene16195 [Halteria grandinella]|uniref:Ubiquitin-like protein ATG12 n=1 Tax=Halteria grandinella TaxID=5974 RepID=A0A8J8NBG2_HALGN|nr:hypothetical protein FGO68_gene16195 [Halteria grandinella]
MDPKQQTDPDFIDDNDDGIEISLNAVGKASKLKTSKIKVKRKHTFQNVITFVRTQLEKGQALKPDQSLFLYINSQFAPSPNERINDLFECFKTQNMLIVNYSITEAWG